MGVRQSALASVADLSQGLKPAMVGGLWSLLMLSLEYRWKEDSVCFVVPRIVR